MKLCVALDLPSKEENLTLIRQLKSENIWLKVALECFITHLRFLIKENIDS